MSDPADPGDRTRFSHPGTAAGDNAPASRRLGRVAVGALVTGALIAVSMAGAVGVNLLHSRGEKGPTSHATARNGSCPPSFTLNDALARSVTLALQRHDRASFLALAGTPQATSRMRLWWENLDEIGFSTGGAELGQQLTTTTTTTGDDLDSAQQVVLQIGVHNRLDSVTTDTVGKLRGIHRPDAPATGYRLRTATRQGAGGCQLAIQEWTSLSDAPWDLPEKLYVVTTAHAVVAGERRNRAAIDRAASRADHAYTWLKGLFAANGHGNYVDQKGYLVFVATTGSQAETWFRGPQAKKPTGWVGDSANVAGFAFPLPGVDPPAEDASTGQPAISRLGSAGGARVILTPAGARESPTRQQATLVHEFTHAVFSASDLGLYVPGAHPSAATVEGAARFIETIFLSDPGGHDGRAFRRLQASLKPHFSQFTGKLPTDAQIYHGSAGQGGFYYDLSATAFDFIASRDGLPFTLQSMYWAYVQGGGPLSGIVTKTSRDGVTFADPAKMAAAWATWIPQAMRQ